MDMKTFIGALILKNCFLCSKMGAIGFYTFHPHHLKNHEAFKTRNEAKTGIVSSTQVACPRLPI
jgi:hypothetical protein